ncbi:DUF3630 family protein [Thalassotalea euphylliae]|uniref:DUF3630 family protein n=1 Tax=Thalassotalea euphylliae TaxID=1655234 RepID=A0A3E0TXC1_9GAMM|nr:DUF3630 family protein [Thalassotalea euphylliae]REL28615.1 DUF3630 family protein [Thalassotalea euphylliae]
MQQLTPSSSLAISAVWQRDDHLDIRFDGEFDEEDFTPLTQRVLDRLDNARVLENIPGADRHNVRFSLQLAGQNGYFVLNFEVYSQSCWLAAESDSELLILTELHHLLSGGT